MSLGVALTVKSEEEPLRFHPIDMSLRSLKDFPSDPKAFQCLGDTTVDSDDMDDGANFFLRDTIVDRATTVELPFMHLSQSTDHRQVHH